MSFNAVICSINNTCFIYTRIDFYFVLGARPVIRFRLCRRQSPFKICSQPYTDISINSIHVFTVRRISHTCIENHLYAKVNVHASAYYYNSV